MSQLLDKAKSLGIDNTEGLTQKQLEKAIKAKEDKLKEAAETSRVLRETAKSFEIETEGKTDEQIASEVEAAKLALEHQKEINLFNEKVDLLTGFLGIDNFIELSVDGLKDILLEKSKNVQVVNAEEVKGKTDEGKTSKPFTVNGVAYSFSEDAPGVFRYLGKLQSQKEWLKDESALELMVSGKLSYVKPAKN